MKLLRYGKPVGTIFDLLGSKEDDMTYSLGYVMSRSPQFVDRVVRHVAGADISRTETAIVRLQTVTPDAKGRTDVEVSVGHDFCAIFEAKRYSQLPSHTQLDKYALHLQGTTAGIKRLVAVTNAPDHYATHALPVELRGIAVTHLSWHTVKQLAEQSRAGETNRNKHLLEEFVAYLKEILGMAVGQSNMVYVVAIGHGQAWNVDYFKVVQQDRKYFYPTEGGGWPEPPNYIAFRYDGCLQAIHHVESFTIFDNPHDIFPEALDKKILPHYCLELGPPIVPPKKVVTGPKIRWHRRVWCAIDTLLTSESITKAHAETKKRLDGDSRFADDEDAPEVAAAS